MLIKRQRIVVSTQRTKTHRSPGQSRRFILIILIGVKPLIHRDGAAEERYRLLIMSLRIQAEPFLHQAFRHVGPVLIGMQSRQHPHRVAISRQRFAKTPQAG